MNLASLRTRFGARKTPRAGRPKKLKNVLHAKWKEAALSVLPIALIVLVLCFFAVPVPVDALAGFGLATVMLVIGMGLFNLGTEMAMTPIGESVGHAVTRSKKLWFVLLIGFLVGVLATIAEPDLTVLAKQVQGVDDMIIILTVALGVGIFLALALLRILYRVRMAYLLLASYGLVFLLSFFVPASFLSVTFDSGGVTTGPMTVPFIMGLGVGVAASRSDDGAEADSFGLVALSSVGPIIAMMVLSLVCQVDDTAVSSIRMTEAADSMQLFRLFTESGPEYLWEVLRALAPIVLFFTVFQFTMLHIRGQSLRRIGTGLVYTYVGLAIFLLGVNVGFMPVGHFLGKTIGAFEHRWLLVPLGMLIGWFTVAAEPAVQVLNKQVYEMTAGAIPRKALSTSLSAGVSVSVGLSMLRVLTGIPIMYILVPGYALVFLLMLFTPPVFTSIAFDSGGVASGPMTATFLLPLSMGACAAVGGNVAADAFGVVAMVAMTPMIAIQTLGIVFKLRQRRQAAETARQPLREEIIELM